MLATWAIANKQRMKDEKTDDGAVFRAAIGRVRPLAAVEQAPQRPRPPPRPKMREADERAALEASQRTPSPSELESSAFDAVEYRRNEIAPQILRRLKRGEFSVQDAFDLHRMNAATAETALRRFLQEARAANHHCVMIVHGKGLHSGHGPVLKHLVERILARRADVLAYTSALSAQGGTGAVLVLLRATRGRLSAKPIGFSAVPTGVGLPR